jgi:hypothetical protein
VSGFFAVGGLTLLAALSFLAAWWRRATGTPIAENGWWAVARLGLRGPRQRPGRATAAVALIAFATFTVVAVGAFRRDPSTAHLERRSGTGGFALIGESIVPLMHDPTTPAGRDAFALPPGHRAVLSASFTRLRLRPGDDASCLTLYRPTRPRVAGIPDGLIDSDRFAFAKTLAASDAERARPWTLLRRTFADGAIPAIGDANSLAYVFHVGLGDTIAMEAADGMPVALRIVGMLADSVFQSELLVSESQFVRLFPREEGYRLLLVDVPAPAADDLVTLMEDRLGDYGLDLQTTGERLAAFHRVENTYISTFQTLGGLGLLLGTCGVGAIVLRTVLERRRELALLRAVGYRPSHLSLMVVAECVAIACAGSAVGAACALLAIAPALAQHGGRTTFGSGVLLLPVMVVLVAALSSLAGVWTVNRMRVAETIRAE